jgi:CRISPR/Cas system-associated exonuclease Cas4 (RecB family)
VNGPVFTGSSLHRVAACPASVSLPQVRSISSPAAARGTAIHRYLQRALEVGRPAALDEIEDEDMRAACAAIDLERLPAADVGQWAPEVSFAYNPVTDKARELGRGDAARDYTSAADEEICCTVDVVGVTEDAVIVVDYKTGHKAVAKAADNWQLALGALAASRVYGKRSAFVAIAYTREGRDPWYDASQHDEWALEDWAGRVRKVHSTALKVWASTHAGTVPDVTEGEHCRFCPAFTSCPAKVRLIQTLGSEPGSLVASMPSPITQDMAAHVYRRLKLVKEALDQLNSQLYAYAAESPIELGDGLVFGAVSTERDEVQGDVARAVLLDKYGPVIADKAAEWDVTKASVKKAATAVAVQSDRKIAPVEREMLEAIRAAGGIKVKHGSTIREHRRKAG